MLAFLEFQAQILLIDKRRSWSIRNRRRIRNFYANVKPLFHELFIGRSVFDGPVDFDE